MKLLFFVWLTMNNQCSGQSAACPRGHGAGHRMQLIETSSQPRGHGLMALAHLRWLHWTAISLRSIATSELGH